MSKPDNGFDEFLRVFRGHAGYPTVAMIEFLRIAYDTGHTAGAAKAASIMMPGIRAAMTSAESGAAAFQTIKDIPDKIDDLLATSAPKFTN